MGMVEIAYELRDLGDYFTGSENFEWGGGIDWLDFVEKLVDNPRILPETLVWLIVDCFANRESNKEVKATYSAIKLRPLNLLPFYFNNFIRNLSLFFAEEEFSFIVNAIDNSTFYKHKSMDIITFLDNLQHNIKLMEEYNLLDRSISELKYVLQQSILWNYQHSSFEGTSNGLAIYFPFPYYKYTQYDGCAKAWIFMTI